MVTVDTSLRRIVAPLIVLAASLVAVGSAAGSPAAAAPSCPQRVLMLGDSITQMMGDHTRLKDLLNQAGCVTATLYNGGAGGRNSGDVDRGAPFAINAVKPDLIVYMIGTNDDPNGFETRYANSLGQIREFAGPGIKILSSINQCPKTPPAPGWINMPAKNRAIYRQGFDMANNRFRPNIVGFMSNDRIPSSLMGSDGFHPTAEGLTYIQEYEYNAIAGVYGLTPTPVNPRATGGSCT